MRCGADLVALPAEICQRPGSDGRALLQGDRVDPEGFSSLGWLQTISPSALLLASCEASLSDGKPVTGEGAAAATAAGEAFAQNLLRDGLPLLSTQFPCAWCSTPAVRASAGWKPTTGCSGGGGGGTARTCNPHLLPGLGRHPACGAHCARPGTRCAGHIPAAVPRRL